MRPVKPILLITLLISLLISLSIDSSFAENLAAQKINAKATTETQPKIENAPIYGPIFKDYGAVFKVGERDVELPKDFNYRVVFDISHAATKVNQVNRSIESVARFINMHALNGVKLEQMNIAVVLHGSATRDGLTQQAYNDRHSIKNPTHRLIQQLSAKGVRFFQCGQSAHFSGVDKSELMPSVKLALSAMTMLVILQNDGYQLLP